MRISSITSNYLLLATVAANGYQMNRFRRGDGSGADSLAHHIAKENPEMAETLVVSNTALIATVSPDVLPADSSAIPTFMKLLEKSSLTFSVTQMTGRPDPRPLPSSLRNTELESEIDSSTDEIPYPTLYPTEATSTTDTATPSERSEVSSDEGQRTSSIPIESSTPESLYSLNKKYSRNIMNALGSSKGNCSSKNALIRRSWSRISDDDRKDYLSAIGCINRRLQNTIHDEGPTIHTDALRFRIDDFVLVHTEWSYLSLFSGTYFHWHRWFLHLYETALRDECGYTGTLPYWDFSEYADDITTDPIFSGDSVSMGGNGAAKSHGWVRVNYFDEKFMVPPGDGGGCVSTPLENYTARLGLPLVYDTDTAKTTDHPWPTYDAAGYVAIVKNNGYDWNDRCITRDLSPWIGQLLEASRIEYDLSCPDFECLMNRINGLEPAYRYIQNLVNTARFAVGGLQLDPLTAPNDPIFWLIQSNIDRLFSVWQGQDLEARVNQTAGKHNPWNRESEHPYHGDPVRLDEDLTIGPIDQIWTRSTGDFSSTIDGPLLCYYYDSH